MTNGVASAGMGPDLTRPASSVGRPSQGRDGSGRDGFAALMEEPREKPAQAPEGAGSTQDGGPVIPEEERRPAEKEGDDQECVDALLPGPQAGPILIPPMNPRELASRPVGGSPKAEPTEAEQALPTVSELRPRGAEEVTTTKPSAEAEAEMIGEDQPGVWSGPPADLPKATGEAAKRPTPMAGPWTSPSERVLNAILQGPVETTDPPVDSVDAPVLDVPVREGPDAPGAAFAPREGRTSMDLPVLPGNGRVGLGSWAASGAYVATGHEPSRTAGLPSSLPKDGSPPNVGPVTAAAEAIVKGAGAPPALYRPGTSKAPKGIPVVEDATSNLAVPKATGEKGGKGEALTSQPVLPPTDVGRPKAMGDEPAPGPGMRVRDVARPAGKEDQVPDAQPTGWSMGAGALGSVPVQAVPTEARRIVRQVASHPVLRTGGSAEVSLAPVELGHLRLSVEMGEGGLRVVIEAARPETGELMRRHVENLRQELRQEGLGEVSVSISGGESRQGGGRSPSGRQDPVWTAMGAGATTGGGGPAPLDSPAPRPARAAGQLDLRF